MIFIRTVVFGGIVAGILLLAWATLIEPGQIRFREYPIRIEGWPQELAGFSIAFVTDPHVGSPHITPNHMADIVAMTNQRTPDLVLLGGDYVIQNIWGGHKVPSAEIASILGKLHGRYGLYGILGNHDWWDGGPRIKEEFEQQHITMLEDAARFIKVGSAGFWLVGLSDFNQGPHNLKKAFAHVKGDAPVIAFTHSPDVFPKIPATVDLLIAGHTHGGQVYVPFLGRPVIPSRYGQRYAIGLIKEDGHQLFVGSGIGTSMLPVRFLTPPEVSILRIYPAAISEQAK